MVADRARGPPYREFPEGSELGDPGFETVPGGGPERDRRTYRQTTKTVLADREGEPSVAGDAESQDGLARRDRFAGFGDEEPRDPVDGRGQARLRQLSLEVGDRRQREGDLAPRDGDLFLRRASLL